MLGTQPRRGRGAEDVHDAPQAALLVDAELARTAEVDRAQPAGAPGLAAVGALGRRPAAVGLIEQRVDLGGGGEVAHRTVTSLDPASRTVTFPVATCTRTVRPTPPAVAVAVTGRPARCSSVRTAASLGAAISRPVLMLNISAPPTRIASRDSMCAP